MKAVYKCNSCGEEFVAQLAVGYKDKPRLQRIAVAMGGIKSYRLKDGREFGSVRATINALGENDAYMRGRSASDIIISGHPNDVTLIFYNDREMTAKQATIMVQTCGTHEIEWVRNQP